MPAIASLALVLLAAAGPTPAAPPPETLKRAEDAFAVLDGKGFVGSYLLTVKADVEAPGEDERSFEVQEVTIEPDGTKRTRLVKAVENGRDVTAERLAQGEGEERESADREEHSIELDGLPFADGGKGVRFGKVRQKDGLLLARFDSRAGSKRVGAAEDDEGDVFDEGEIAWDAASGDPVWVDLGAGDPPRFVSEISLRLEYGRTAGVLHPTRIVTKTKAGVPLLFRVKVDIDVAVSEVKPVPR